MTITYQEMFIKIVQIMDKYSFGSMLAEFDSSLINILLDKYLDKVREAIDYDTTTEMINLGLSVHLGVMIKIDTFITRQDDRESLYELFSEWRSQLLLESAA